VLQAVADRVDRVRGRARVAVDGLTAAGKTSFGHELAVVLAERGRVVLRASLDDFKRPWREAHQYDRVTGDGYYRNAFDLDAIHRLLLEPSGPEGSGMVALCSIDPVTQIDHHDSLVHLPDEGVLVVDGVFALREELAAAWDLTIWLSIDPELSIARGVERDAAAEGGRRHAETLHRDRYLAAEQIYIDDVDPVSRADIVIDNTDFAVPVLKRC
jgi:uridine kinase